tara:strand:- start:136 stop:480 length:345 start_codon:yes stop_codon:yes gene_type:complete
MIIDKDNSYKIQVYFKYVNQNGWINVAKNPSDNDRILNVITNLTYQMRNEPHPDTKAFAKLIHDKIAEEFVSTEHLDGILVSLSDCKDPRNYRSLGLQLDEHRNQDLLGIHLNK